VNKRSTDGPATRPAADRLLDAVDQIFANESPSTVSMRTIAKQADCSVGLAYNYFESRDELIGAALDRLAHRITADAVSSEGPREALLALLESMRANAAFPRMMTWLILEGADVSAVMSGHPLLQRIAATADERGVKDPPGAAMMVALLAIGTFTFGPMLNHAAGREPDDGRLVESVADMLADWFPQPIG
jgi:AcrR family transcriptional regulator